MAEQSTLGQLATGFSNGAKAFWDGAKWVAGGGTNGPQPPQYVGGETYPNPQQSQEFMNQAQMMLKRGLISPEQFEQFRAKMGAPQ